MNPRPKPSSAQSPQHALRLLIRHFAARSRVPDSCQAGTEKGPDGPALVLRLTRARTLLVAGATPMATGLRALIADGEAPGWELHPAAEGRTPLRALAAPLRDLTGSGRAYSTLARAGYGYAEEIAATPDELLSGLRGTGPKFIAAVRQVTRDYGPPIVHQDDDRDDDMPAADEYTDPYADPDPDPDLTLDLDTEFPHITPATLRALRVACAWAVNEQGAQTVADLTQPDASSPDTPWDVAAAWTRLRNLGLRTLAGPLASSNGVTQLTGDLLAELDPDRHAIITQRTFAREPAAIPALAADLGISPAQVRQLEKDALEKLACLAEQPRYAPLRWRAVSITRKSTPQPPSGQSSTERLLTWLASPR